VSYGLGGLSSACVSCGQGHLPAFPGFDDMPMSQSRSHDERKFTADECQFSIAYGDALVTCSIKMHDLFKRFPLLTGRRAREWNLAGIGQRPPLVACRRIVCHAGKIS
jgi:hypothetical protein